MSTFKNVELTKKANVYFDGNVTSRSFVDENGEDKGYLVEYVDGGKANTEQYSGYVSWSPEDVFERAYSETEGMTFGLALEAMKKGHKVTREGWNGKDMFAVISKGYELDADRFFSPHLKEHANKLGGKMKVRDCFLLKTAQDDVAYWAPSGSDCRANDWQIVE